MTRPVITSAEYRRRRKQLMRMMGKDSIALISAAPERIRNRDAHYPYRQDSDFAYLTGLDEPDAVLALVPSRKSAEVVLFLRSRDPDRERWDGERLGPERAPAALLVDDAFPIEDIDDILPGLIEGRSRVFYHFGRDPGFDQHVLQWLERIRAQVKQGARPPHEFIDLGHCLHDLRLFKSRAEIQVMRESARIAGLAHRACMRAIRPGQNEADVQAEFEYVLRKHQAVNAYEPIVGAGPNACVLHYRSNRSPIRDGDLLLLDGGAEYQWYASDITRTYPANGRFSAPQRQIYELVLAAQHAAIREARPGRPFTAMHDAAVRTLAKGLIELELLTGTLREVLTEHRYRRFYMHKTGHWLGLDVHDVGDYRVHDQPRVLEPGMVLTIEPGLYFAADDDTIPEAYRGIGVRIEDDVLITKWEPDILTADVPKTVAEIEHWMAGLA